MCARLRRSNIDGAEGSVEELTRIVGQMRQSWPEVKIIIRADSVFCRDDLMSWCEDEKNRVDYALGLAKNARLKKEIAEELKQAEAQFGQTQQPSRVFKDFQYQTLNSWSRERRVIGKAEWMEKGANPRFVVTSLPPERMGVYMGVFNFFIVIPEIIAAIGFGALIRTLFGANNPNAPLYVVMMGGVFLLVAAVCVGFVRDVGGRDVPEGAVIRGDASEPFTVQESVQPVPSTGLIDDR